MKKTAYVTGATSGIGKAFAEILMENGYDVTIIGRSTEKLEYTKNDLLEKYSDASLRTIQTDLANKEELEALCQMLQKEEPDVFINNAGFNKAGAFYETDYTEEENMILVNVAALTRLTKAVLPGMVKRGSGKILNISSIAAFAPNPLSCIYGASKAYVKSFSEAVNEEVRGTGVTVTALCPGPTESNFASTSNLDNSKIFAKNVMKARDVAEIGYRAMMKGKRSVVAGWRNKMLVCINYIAPKGIILKFAKSSLDDK